MFEILENNPVIGAISSDDSFERALTSPCAVLFMLNSNLLTLRDKVQRAHKANKKIFVHVDMAEGVGKDKIGVEFLKTIGVDGLITTKNNLVLAGKRCGLTVVQRFFIIDSKSLTTAIDSARTVVPDMVELMPGLIGRAIERFSRAVKIPVIAGGLIESDKDVIKALSKGATAISTSREELWNE